MTQRGSALNLNEERVTLSVSPSSSTVIPSTFYPCHFDRWQSSPSPANLSRSYWSTPLDHRRPGPIDSCKASDIVSFISTCNMFHSQIFTLSPPPRHHHRPEVHPYSSAAPSTSRRRAADSTRYPWRWRYRSAELGRSHTRPSVPGPSPRQA